MSNDTISALSRPSELAEYASQLRTQQEFGLAGEFYTVAAHANFSLRRRLPEERSKKRDAGTNSPLYIASGVLNILAAALCYRIAGANSRARTYSEVGIRVVEDATANESRFVDRSARQGLAQELLGDLRLFGDLGEYDEAYSQAAPYYEAVESPTGWLAEPDFENTILWLFDLADSIGEPVASDTRNSAMRDSFSDRIQLKRDRYPGIVDGVLKQGSWKSSLF